MRHEPCALVGDAENAVELVCTHALLAGAKQMESIQPLVQRNVAIFHDRAYRDCELFAAAGALQHALTRFRTSLRLYPVRCSLNATVRANGTMWPSFRFEEGARRVQIRESGLITEAEFGFIGLQHCSIMCLFRWVCQVY